MRKSTTIFLIIILLVVAVGAYFLVAGSSDNKDEASNKTSSSSEANSDNDEGAGLQTTEQSSAEVAATINYTDDGFSPSSVTIKAGDTIKIVNSSSMDLNFASDPHPVHTDDPELNAGDIAPGSSKTFVVSNKGSWGFHNHENESDTGTLIVQ